MGRRAGRFACLTTERGRASPLAQQICFGKAAVTDGRAKPQTKREVPSVLRGRSRRPLRLEAFFCCPKPRRSQDAATEQSATKTTKKGSERKARCPIWLVPSPGTSPRSNLHYWLSGLNTRMPASVLEQAPAGSTRTTASSSAQNARMPVWFTVLGFARMVYPTFRPLTTVPAPVTN
jgi:hypothetical protein